MLLERSADANCDRLCLISDVLQSIYSSLAQSVEHLTVNQGVAGSSPAGGASTFSSVGRATDS